MPHSANTVTMIVIVRPMPNFVTATALTSRSSCPVFGCSSSLSAMFQSLVQVRIANRQQRPLIQLRGEGPEPDAAERHGRGKIHPTDAELIAAEVGHYQPVEIHKTHNQDDHRNFQDKLCASFDLARKQQRER